MVRERDDAFMSTLDPDDAAPFLEMSPRLTRDTWERFREHALPGVRAVDEEALKRLSARYVLDAVPEEAAPPFEGPALILTGREDHLVGYRDQAALLEHYPRATYAALDAAGSGALGFALGEEPADEEPGMREHPARDPAPTRAARSTGRRLMWCCGDVLGSAGAGVSPASGAAGR